MISFSQTCGLRAGWRDRVTRGRPALLSALVLSALAPGHAAESTSGPDLIRAVERGDAARWRPLLQAGDAVRARDAAGNTALHVAALNHDLVAVTALLAAGAEVDAKNDAGATPLLYGAGQAGIVRALLARGANPNATSTSRNTPLMAAAAQPGASESVRLLLDAGADLNATRSSDVPVPLTRAVNSGDRAIVELLVARGAARHPKAAGTALSAAALAGLTPVVEHLLAQEADPNFEPTFAGHALNGALWNGQAAAARLLIARGADLNLRSPSGHGTPPMVFAGYDQSGDPAVARLLVERGVDVNVANDQGATALSYALRNGPDTPLVAYLRSVGAKEPRAAPAKRVPDREVPPTPSARAALVRARLPATLKLLQRSSDAFLDNGFVQKANCTSCHGQDLPAVAYGLARERGFAIDELSLGRQFATQLGRWRERAEFARQMAPALPGAPVTMAYGLYGLRLASYPADAMTDAMVRYLLRTQQPDGSWFDFTRRQPMEDGPLVATAWVALSVRDYAPAGYERVATESLARSARWLAARTPATLNEAVMQVLGLHWSGVPASGAAPSIERLVRLQRPDGGWAQMPGLESDAWATGSALYALHESGGMKAIDAVYQRGVAFLLRTQFEDGSWWVRSRAWPFQPHFNGQFPHGRDQWISQGGTAWAAMALLLTLEPARPAPRLAAAPELVAAYGKSPAAQRQKAGTAATAAPAATSAAVDFTRDIQPIFERSCAGCHGGEKPKGEFALVSRDALLKGGASGEPAIAPGYADESLMIQYVSGKIEDLEMPPLDRREKYPALSPAEIELLRIWIESGAPWAAVKTVSNAPR